MSESQQNSFLEKQKYVTDHWEFQTETKQNLEKAMSDRGDLQPRLSKKSTLDEHENQYE